MPIPTGRIVRRPTARLGDEHPHGLAEAWARLAQDVPNRRSS
ncbi:hypothetical protein [Nonomuraea insulae]|uniref:Uncharacterized protein n=1 Tax=Nonomuraea insulae TaxID=1616787 RepID=A0ABW1CV94_9ACTN